MPNTEIQIIFRENLKFYLSQKQSSQLELANYLNVSNTTVNNWVKGYSMPRMNKVDKICNFFNISRSDLIEKKTAPPEHEINIDEAIKKAYGETTKDAVELFTQLDLLDQGQTIGTMKLLLDAPKYKKEKSGA